MAGAVFITIEGGEGVGKTLFTEKLKARLEDAGKKVKTTREPGGTPAAQAIRELFLSPPEEEALEALTELLLVSAARHQHVKKLIEPALDANYWVVCDRFVDSSRVYQGIVGGYDRTSLETVTKMSIGSCEPDITFLLDCSPEVSLNRLALRGVTGQQSNRFDAANLAFHRQLRDGFLRLAKEFPNRIVVLDASQDPAAVLAQALNTLKEKFGISFD